MKDSYRAAWMVFFVSVGLVIASVARAGMIDVAASAVLITDVVTDLQGGNAGATDHQESHHTGGINDPNIKSEAHASVPVGDLSISGSFGTAVTQFISSPKLLTISGNVDAGFDPKGHALKGNVSAVGLLDLPLTIRPGFIGRFDLSVSIFHITPDGGEVNVEFDRLGTEILPVLHMTFHKDFAKHYIDRLEAGDYRLKVTAKALADSDNVADLPNDSSSAGYAMSISPSTVPVVVPLPTTFWPGLLSLFVLFVACHHHRSRQT